MKYELKTNVFKDGRIEQDLLQLDGPIDLAVRLSQRIVDTQDLAIRNALISLGWTPPPEEDAQ